MKQIFNYLQIYIIIIFISFLIVMDLLKSKKLLFLVILRKSFILKTEFYDGQLDQNIVTSQFQEAITNLIYKGKNIQLNLK